MKLLLDTHILLWAAAFPGQISAEGRDRISDPQNELLFSAASLWEIATKSGLGREDSRSTPVSCDAISWTMIITNCLS